MRFLRLPIAILGLCLLGLSDGVSAAAAGELISPLDGYAALPKCNSTCALTDAACLCNDARFNSDATACVKAGCSIRETLSAKNVTELMCGHEPERDNSLIPIYSVFIGLAVVAVALRLVARVLTQAYFWWDDFSNLFGFFFYVEMLLYTVTRFFVRTSVILFYLRVFPPKPDNKLGRALQYTMAFNVVYNLGFLLAVAFQCTPVTDFWTQWEGIHRGHCGNANVLVWVAAITGIIYDLWLLAMPFPQLLSLNVHWKKKLMGGIMFFVEDIVQVCLWSGIELDVGVICPCLPSFRLLLRRLLPRVLGSTGRYELDPMSTAATGGGMRSGARRSFGGGPTRMSGGGGGGASGADAGAGVGAGKIVVENTFAIKYGSSADLEDSETRSSASVRGLVQGRVSVGDEERGGGNGGERKK
ncbi:uncharacterized protein P884DRAFT_195225 [Thermothelomyces heterothallicus CBS 202.75]|uniref:uncharacterized protein n=1 Tax=Thermothelomyces heterothallicus CBS 202.75 TaxID=1149848 RepID=UPI003743388A